MNVPDEFRPGLLQFASLPDEAVDELCGLLDRDLTILTSREKAFDAVTALKKIKREEAFKILEALIPLIFMHGASRKSAEDIVEEMTASLSVGEEDATRLPSALAPGFRKHLQKILSLPAIGLRSKALALSVEVQRTFSDVKVYTDIRPVFDLNELKVPSAAVVLHNFKLQFNEEGEEREVYITLSRANLQEVIDTLTRAIQKDDLLRGLLSKASVSHIDTDD